MSFKNLTKVVSIGRKSPDEKELQIDSFELRKFVEDWLKSQGWQLSDFASLLKSVNVYKPIMLTGLYDRTFKCQTQSQGEFEITLKFPDSDEKDAILLVSENEGQQERKYTINKNNANGETTISAHLDSKILKDKDNIFRELRNYYYDEATYRVFQDVTFSKIVVAIKEKASTKWPLSDYKIESYLMTLKKGVTCSEILDGIYGLVPTLKETAIRIEITCHQVVEGDERMVDWIKMENGRIWRIGTF